VTAQDPAASMTNERDATHLQLEGARARELAEAGAFDRSLERLGIEGTDPEGVGYLELDGTLLGDYLELCRPTTDAPWRYHLAVGLGLMSVVLGHHVVIPETGGFEPMCPNLYICLLGPSSRMRKTTALNMGKRILIDLKEKANRSLLYPDEYTPESLYDILQEQSVGVLVASEFASFLDRSKRDYMAGVDKFLADIYDCPKVKSKRLRGHQWTISNPAVSFWGASSFEWFRDAATGGHFRGGFLARFLWIPAFAKDCCMPRTKQPNFALMSSIVDNLATLGEVKGSAKITPAAWSEYESWYQDHDRDLIGDPNGGVLDPLWSRLEQAVLKLSVLFSLSADPTQGGLQVDAGPMEKAIGMIEDIKRWVRDLALEQLDADPRWGRDYRRIRDVIERASANGGKITTRDISHATSGQMPARRRREILDELKEAGIVESERIKPGAQGGRPGEWFWLAPYERPVS